MKEVEVEVEKDGHANHANHKTSEKKPKSKGTKELPKGQLKLTDMF